MIFDCFFLVFVLFFRWFFDMLISYMWFRTPFSRGHDTQTLKIWRCDIVSSYRQAGVTMLAGLPIDFSVGEALALEAFFERKRKGASGGGSLSGAKNDFLQTTALPWSSLLNLLRGSLIFDYFAPHSMFVSSEQL